MERSLGQYGNRSGSIGSKYDRLLLESPPQPHPRNLLGKVVRIIVIWERDK